MRLVSLRADGRPHRMWQSVYATPVPGAYLIPSGAQVEESSGACWSSDYPVVGFFWAKLYFQVFMLLKENRTDYYANVILPPLLGPDVFFVDLDLDMTVTSGRVELQDEMEFMERKAAYPTVWVEEAEHAAERLMQLATRKQGPFQPATAQRWRALIRDLQHQDSGC